MVVKFRTCILLSHLTESTCCCLVKVLFHICPLEEIVRRSVKILIWHLCLGLLELSRYQVDLLVCISLGLGASSGVSRLLSLCLGCVVLDVVLEAVLLLPVYLDGR